MHVSLFVLGVMTTLAGFAAVIYGLPEKEFSFGNTVIIAGTITAVGGFLLIGLAACVQELKRIADSHRQAQMPLPMHPVEPFRQPAQSNFPAVPATAPQMMAPPAMAPQVIAPMPSKPNHMPRAPSPLEPKLAPALTTEAEPLEWMRPKEKTPGMGEQSLIEEIEASLTPQPISSTSPPPPLKVYDQTYQQGQPALQASAEPAMEAVQAVNPEPAPGPASTAEHAASSGLFDAVWPEVRPTRHPETIARARKPDVVAPPRDEAMARGQPGPRRDGASEAPSAAPEEPRPVAILKSGMIDGMAYTLYADGSIEAVLATGTVRFASIDALRIHLEKNG